MHLLDLADTQRVAAFAREFVAAGHALHVLINNAGCLLQDERRTPSGIEMNFAINTLGTYILTRGLLPHLAQHDVWRRLHKKKEKQ